MSSPEAPVNPKKRGRPAIGPRLSTTVSPESVQKLSELAAAEETTLSEVTRDVLEWALRDGNFQKARRVMAAERIAEQEAALEAQEANLAQKRADIEAKRAKLS